MKCHNDTTGTIQYSVHQVIKNNSLEKYPTLIKENEASLIQRICTDDKLKRLYLDLWAKLDQYDQKLHKFLANLAPETVEFPMDLIRYTGPDPRYIANRYHALQYVKLRVMCNDFKRKAIRTVIDEQLAIQQSWKQQRTNIIDKYNTELKFIQDSTNQKPNSCGAMKLQSFKMNLRDNKLKELTENHTAELKKFDESLLFKSKQLATDSQDKLANLNIPFFNLQSQFHYPDLKKDQEYLLEQLQILASQYGD